jgi:hypothetical protein
LCDGVSPPEIRERQQAIKELRDRLDLREDFAAMHDSIRSRVDPERLMRWSEAPPLPRLGVLRWIALGLSFLSLAA